MKTKTPIHQAILKCQEVLKDPEINQSYALGIMGAITILRSLLPEEKKFASDMFDAGQKYDTDERYSDGPDFETFYKNYNQ